MNFINFDKASNDKVMIGSTPNVKLLLQLIIISQKAVIMALTIIHCPAEPNPISHFSTSHFGEGEEN